MGVAEMRMLRGMCGHTRKDKMENEDIREKQQEQIQKALDLGNVEMGKGLNQEMSLMRPCDTRWNSHYGTIVSIIVMFEAVVEVVEWIKRDRNQDNLNEATRLFKDIQTFDFAFHLFLMRLILGISNELSQALQKKYQDIVNTMALVELKELNNRFNEVNNELLLCMACLSPVNNFAFFDKAKIVRLAQLYPQDFDRMDLMNLPIQLDNYIHDMKMHSEFSSLRGISDLAKELVKTGRCESYMLVYKLLTLALVLPVATTLVERAFSAMKIVKTPLRNKMGDQWLSDSMLVYIEKDVFSFIDNEPIMRCFHDMKPRKQQL
ncbi:unnamed protein product [Malus baccata var. baccata]